MFATTIGKALMHSGSIVLALVVALMALTALGDVSPARHVHVAAGDQERTLLLSIAAPADAEGRRTLAWHRGFDVVLINVSDQPRRVWRQSNSLGYDALSFEWSDERGQRHTAHRRADKA